MQFCIHRECSRFRVNFQIFLSNCFCVDVAICDLVHGVETILPLLTANITWKSCLKYE